MIDDPKLATYCVVEFDDESHSSGGAPGPGVEDGRKVRRDSESFIARDESLLIPT